MEPVKVSDPKVISDAIVTWTGWGNTEWPSRDVRRLADRFGAAAASDLLPIVEQLEREFYESDAHLTVSELSEMAKVAGDRFRTLHPELTREAVAALAWCYSYDYK